MPGPNARHPRLGWCVHVFVCAVIAHWGLAARAAVPTTQPKGILVLYDENKDFAGLALLDQSFRTALNAAMPVRPDVYTEYMDVSRFRVADHEVRLREYFRQKYAGKRIDLIVTVMAPSLEFALKHAGDLFPDTPVVFCGIDRRELPETALRPNVTGVLVKREFKPTLELALRLHPKTQNVVFISGTSPFNEYWRERARRELAEFEGRVTIKYLGGLAIEEIQSEVARLPADSVILYLHLFRDGAGKTFDPNEALRLIAQKSNAPIYAFFDQFVGAGAVGGFVYSVEAQGAKAAEVTARVLNGEKPSDIPVFEAGTNVHMFDARQLTRWKIDEGALPSNAVIRFHEPTFWELYRWHTLAAALVIGAQAALIAGLLFQRRRWRLAEIQRHNSETQIANLRENLSHVGRVSTMGQLASALAHEINQPLGAILRNAEAAAIALQSDSPDLEELRSIVADICKDDHRAGDVIDRLRGLIKHRVVEMRRLNVAKLLEEVAAVTRFDAVSRRVRVSVEADANLPDIRGDRVHLQQVLLNLLLNAMDAVNGAPVEQRLVTIKACSNNAQTVEVSVADRGHGIDPGRLTHIFEPFISTKSHGMGMGLPISRTIIEAHGGQIWAENNPDGGGATFRFTLSVVRKGDAS